MDTKSGYPFWVIKNGLLPSFPRVESDQRCDVLVIGGGITGALIADELSRHGYDVVVIEQRDIGWGSTAASTALIQYEIDVPMTALAKRYDEATAGLAYTSCVEAVEELGVLSRSLRDVGYQRTKSIYLASAMRDLPLLENERELRRRYRIPSHLVDKHALAAQFGMRAPAALVTPIAAVIDPYRFTCRLFGRLHRRGVRIFDRSTIAHLSTTSRSVTARTKAGVEIRAGHVVLAMGYAAQHWLTKRVANNRSTYAFVSDPLPAADLAAVAKGVFWETARPYHYLRTTVDHRLLVGGEDERTDNPARRDRRVHSRADALQRYARRLLPALEIEQAFAWAGTFAETRDGLPYFGAHPQRGDRVLFAMAYGGNGITYSVLGAPLLRALIEKRPHRLRALYAFDRGA